MTAAALPARVQRRRTAGWRAPDGAVYVGRPSKWGNRFAVGEVHELTIGGMLTVFEVRDARHATELFERWQAPGLDLRELRGRALMCWCPPRSPCHAEVLLKLANR